MEGIVDSSALPVSETPTKKGKHPLVVYVDRELVGRIDAIGEALDLNRSETSRRLLDLAFKALEIGLPEATQAAKQAADENRVRQRAEEYLNHRFGLVAKKTAP